eukprot:scaffold193_cov255-Pinguiococcus_pyrenoidosus.AAC.34
MCLRRESQGAFTSTFCFMYRSSELEDAWLGPAERSASLLLWTQLQTNSLVGACDSQILSPTPPLKSHDCAASLGGNGLDLRQRFLLLGNGLALARASAHASHRRLRQRGVMQIRSFFLLSLLRLRPELWGSRGEFWASAAPAELTGAGGAAEVDDVFAGAGFG